MVNIMEYTTRMFELGTQLEECDPDDKISTLPILEEMVNLNMDMIEQMKPGSEVVGREEFNSMCDSTSEIVDEIISMYTEMGRQMQVDNFKALKDRLELQKVQTRVIRVV